MKNATYLLGLIIILPLFFGACKKDKDNEPEQTDVLTGVWSEATQQNSTVFLQFKGPNLFSRTVRTDTGYELISIGTYTISGTSLAVNITQTQEKAPTGSIIKTAVNYQLFEKATFSIANRTLLTVSYTTYPADAPVVTEVKFNRVLPID